VSPTLISKVTDQVLDTVQQWQRRTLDRVYPIVYLDGFVVKVRKDGAVRNRTIYIALAVNMHGHKEVLGLWVADTEGAKFWLHVVNELKNRGVEDILIASVDGLKGFPEAIESAFPNTIIQTCIVHMVRSSTNLVAWKYRRPLTADLKTIYRAATETEALEALEAFREKWDGQYPTIGRSWQQNWPRIRPFFELGPEIRKRLCRPRVLIVDEVGYLAYGPRHADLLFEVVSRRYAVKKPILITTNKPFAEWGETFPNATCVVTLVDRLVHRSEIVSVAGASFRLKESKVRNAERRGRRSACFEAVVTDGGRGFHQRARGAYATAAHRRGFHRRAPGALLAVRRRYSAFGAQVAE
jgi:hypothetical protein